MELLNNFADETKRRKMLKDLNLVIESFGNIASVVLPLIKGNGPIREGNRALPVLECVDLGLEPSGVDQ